MHHLGFSNFKADVESYSLMNPIEFIDHALRKLGLKGRAKTRYLQTLLGRTLGWASPFSFHEWQASLGYKEKGYGNNTELLAVYLAYDFATSKNHQQSLSRFVSEYAATADQQSNSINEARNLFQVAWERSVQDNVASKIQKSPPPSSDHGSWCKMVFCIDVRSEELRSSIEKQITGVKTLGFAGFFGLGVDLKNGLSSTSIKPLTGLLSPSYRAEPASKGRPHHSKRLRVSSSMLENYHIPRSFMLRSLASLSAWNLIRSSLKRFTEGVKLRNTVDAHVVDESYEPHNEIR